MEIPLDEVVHCDAITNDITTGEPADADSTPSFAVYEEATDTAIVTGSFTKRTSLTGNYRLTYTASAANGFEVGKYYSVIAAATVGGLNGKTVLQSFRCVAAETTAGQANVTTASISSTAVASIWNALTSGITTAGSIGKLIIDKLGLIISSTTLTTGSLVSNGQVLTIFQGEGRTVAGGNAFTLVVPAASPDITGWTARMAFTKITSNSGTAGPLEITGSISGQTMTFTMTKAQTAALALSTSGTHPFRVNPGSYYAYTYTISGFLSTTECTVFASGYVDVKAKDTTCA